MSIVGAEPFIRKQWVHDKQVRSSAGREALYFLCVNSQPRILSLILKVRL